LLVEVVMITSDARPGQTVVIVEDEPIIRLQAEILIEELGLPVASYERADEALNFIAADVSRIGTVFTDICLPGTLDGLALADQVFARWPWIQIIIVSGTADPDEDDLPPNARFLAKPWRPLDVIAALSFKSH
jgi:DNA-binding NtrC family response regulator